MAALQQFEKEFRKYQKLFGLTGYKVYFEEKPLQDSFAQIEVDHHDMVATATLSSHTSPKRHPKQSAKHEVLHLLVGRLEACAQRRYTSEDDIYTATEELVRKLEEVIP